MDISISKPDQWTVKDISQAFNPEGVGTFFIQLPRFQRTLVWDEDQRRKLVDSLYRGYPIGAVLAYQTEDKRGTRTVLQIVDGLQRTTTISDYLKQPLFYAPVDRVFSIEIMAKIANAAGLSWNSDSERDIARALEFWMREVKIAKHSAVFSANSLISSLAKSLNVLEELFHSILNDINDELGEVSDRVKDIESIAIPVVLYSGDAGNIPTIFERVNNQGTQLSKYEVLASSWVDSQTRVSNEKIRSKVTDRYQLLISRGYEIDGLEAGAEIAVDQFNLYEYLFGFGRYLAEKFPLLFGDPGKADESTPIAFVLVTTAMGLRLSKMSDLASHLRERSGNKPIDLSALEDAIVESAKAINGSLSPYLSLKLHKKDSGSVLAHSQNQILSLVSEYLVNKFDSSTWKSKNSSIANQIVSNAASHYLLDMVVKRWGGSGDSRLFEMTWNEQMDPAIYYAQPVSRQTLVSALITWHEDSLTKAQKERPSVPAVAQAVLLFLYSKLVSHYDNKATIFELEHIYPVAVIGQRIGELKDDGWPISALGNLMLLPKDLNRIKGKHTLGDYLPTIPVDERLSKLELESVEKYLVTPLSSAVTKASLTHKDFYLEFCRLRLKAIAEQIATNLGL